MGKYIIDTEAGTCEPLNHVIIQKQTVADVMESMIGAKEWDDTVKAIQKWFYGKPQESPWCATCFSFCAAICGVDCQTGKFDNVDVMKDFMNGLGRVDCTRRYGGGVYIPKRGDAVFCSSKHVYKDCTHIMAVVDVNTATGYLKAISGNSADRIRYTEHNYLTDPYIVAFGNISY